MRRRLCTVLVLFLLCAQSASAQSFAADVHFASARWDVSSGGDNDYGLGGRVSWTPSSWMGLDANLAWYPESFPRDTDVPISEYRMHVTSELTSLFPNFGSLLLDERFDYDS